MADQKTKYLDYGGLAYYDKKIHDEIIEETGVVAELIETIVNNLDESVKNIIKYGTADISDYTAEELANLEKYGQTDVSDLTDEQKKALAAQKLADMGLAVVAISGNYNDLENLPTIISEQEIKDLFENRIADDTTNPIVITNQNITSYLSNYVQKVIGKGLSTNDFTNELKTKLENLKSAVQSDWNETDTTSAAYIQNKPEDITSEQILSLFGGGLDTSTNPEIVTTSNLEEKISDLGFASQKYIDNKLEDILGIDAEGVSTLAAALNDNDTATGLLKQISSKTDKSDVYSKTESDNKYLTSHQDISGKANTADLADIATSGKYADINYEVVTGNASGAVIIDGSKPLHILTMTGAITSVALSTSPAAGHSTHVIFYSASEQSVSIAHDATARVCPEAADLSLTVKASGYAEVDFLNDGTKIYVRGV